MADLTAELQSPDIFTRIPEPGPKPESPISTGLNFAKTWMNIAGQSQGPQQSSSSQQSQAKEQAVGGAVVDFNNLIQDYRQGTLGTLQSDFAKPGGFQATTDYSDVQKVLDSTQKAQSQGNVPFGTFQMYAQSLYNANINQHPDQAGDIAKSFKELGYDNYINKDLEQQSKAQDFQQTQMQNGLKIAADYYVQQGGDPTKDLGYQVTQGQKYLAAKSAYDTQEQAAKIAQMQAAATRDDTSVKNAEGQNKIYGLITGQSNLMTTPLYDGISRITAGLSPDNLQDQKSFSDLAPQIQAYNSNARNQAITKATELGATPETIGNLNKYFDDREKTINSMFTGDMSAAKTRVETFNQFKATIGIDADTAMPKWAQLRASVGDQALQQLFPPGALKVPPEVIQGLQKEFMGINDHDAASARQFMLDAARVMRGDTTLRALSPVTARQQLPMLFNATATGAQSYLYGGGNSQSFATPYANVLDAANQGVQPGRSTLKDMNWAATGVGNVSYMQALDKYTKEDPNMGGITMNASRAVQAKLLNVYSNNIPPGSISTNFGTVQYNKNTHQYDLVFDRQAYNKYAQLHPPSYVQAPGAFTAVPAETVASADYYKTELTNNKNSELYKAWQNSNTLLSNLTQTDKYDPQVDTSLNDTVRRDRWASGLPPTRQSDKPTQNSQPASMSTQIEAMHQMLVKGPAAIDTSELAKAPSPPPPPSKQNGYVTADQIADYGMHNYGLSKEAVAGLIGHVSHEAIQNDAGDFQYGSTNPHDGNGPSHGMFQFHDSKPGLGTLSDYKNWLGDKPDDWQHQMDFVMKTAPRDVLANLRAAKTPEEAARVWFAYERPKGYTPGHPEGVPSYRGRLAAARKWYDGNGSETE